MEDYLQGIVVAARGVPMTLAISLVAVLGGLVIGLLIAIAKRSKFKVLRALATIYVDVLRGTPLLVQVLILAYGVPQMIRRCIVVTHPNLKLISISSGRS